MKSIANSTVRNCHRCGIRPKIATGSLQENTKMKKRTPPSPPETPNQPGRKKESFKNRETNPFCRTSPACPIHSPATNKQKVIMFLKGGKNS